MNLEEHMAKSELFWTSSQVGRRVFIRKVSGSLPGWSLDGVQCSWCRVLRGQVGSVVEAVAWAKLQPVV